MSFEQYCKINEPLVTNYIEQITNYSKKYPTTVNNSSNTVRKWFLNTIEDIFNENAPIKNNELNIDWDLLLDSMMIERSKLGLIDTIVKLIIPDMESKFVIIGFGINMNHKGDVLYKRDIWKAIMIYVFMDYLRSSN